MLTPALLLLALAAAPDGGSTATAPSAARAPAALPEPPALELPPAGARLTRTMALLASATPERRPVVKILVYGQSISKGSWSRLVRDELARRYPHAELVFENRAIGGFAASTLVRAVEHDVLPFYPDLVLFHVYGSEEAYEEIVRQVRTRTTAEMLVFSDHLTPTQDEKRHDAHSWVWLPALARRWGLELVDARGGWIRHLKARGLPPEALVAKDRLHLNGAGNALLAELVLAHLVHDPARPADPHGLVRTIPVPKEARWRGDRLVLPFEGNRIDVVASAVAPGGGAAARVLVDGRPPSQIPELYTLSRPNADPNRDWPWQTGAAFRVERRAPLPIEEWKLRFTSVGPGAKTFTFDAFGSVTGFDGSGKSDEPFLSRSGRIAIAPGDWFIDRAAAKPFETRIAPGYVVTFRVEPRFVDTYAAPSYAGPGLEPVTIVAQGLPPGRHTLELVAPRGRRPEVAAIRVYRPLAAPLP